MSRRTRTLSPASGAKRSRPPKSGTRGSRRFTRPAGKRRLAISGLSDARLLNHAVDRRLAAIVAMALEDRVGARYRDGAAFRDELDRYLAGRSLRALPMNPIRRFALRYRRNPLRTTIHAASLLLVGVLVWCVGYVGNSVTQVYGAAASAAALDAQGALVDAAGAYGRLRESPLAPYLPGLDDELERARSFWGESEFARICTLLGSEDVDALAAAHVALQRYLLTKGHESRRPPLIRFLRRELESDRPLTSRRLAAETIVYYLVIHPYPYEGVPDSDSGLHDLEPILLEIAQGSGSGDGQLELRRLAASALSGMSSNSAFEALIDLMRADDRELQRVATHAARRIWYKVREEGMLLELPQELLRDWSLAANEIVAPEATSMSPAIRNMVQYDFGAVAWTRMLLRDAGTLEDWQALPEDLQAHLDKLETELSKLREDGTPSLVAGFRGGWWQPGNQERTPTSRRSWCEKQFGSTRNPFDYMNIWADEGPDPSGETSEVVGERREVTAVDSLGVAQTTVDAGIRFSDAKLEPHLIGAGLHAGWEKGEPQFDSSPGKSPCKESRYIQFECPGRSKFELVTAVPPRVQDAVIILEHCYAMRYFLPWGGHARVRVSFGAEGPTHLLDVPGGTSEVRLYLDNHVLAEKEELRVLVELVSASTTYRLYGAEVRFRLRAE